MLHTQIHGLLYRVQDNNTHSACATVYMGYTSGSIYSSKLSKNISSGIIKYTNKDDFLDQCTRWQSLQEFTRIATLSFIVCFPRTMGSAVRQVTR